MNHKFPQSSSESITVAVGFSVLSISDYEIGSGHVIELSSSALWEIN